MSMTAEELHWRNDPAFPRLGSSEAPGVVLWSPYETNRPTMLYAYKTGLMSPEETDDSDGVLLRGQVFETVTPPLFEDRYPEYRVVETAEVFPDADRWWGTVIDPSNQWATAKPDFIVLHRETGKVIGPLENKTVSWQSLLNHGWGEDGSTPAKHALGQNIWQCIVIASIAENNPPQGWPGLYYDRPHGFVTAICGLDDFRVYNVPWRDGLSRALWRACQNFMLHNVGERVPPEPDDGANYGMLLADKFGIPETPTTATLEGDVLEMAKWYRALRYMIEDVYTPAMKQARNVIEKFAAANQHCKLIVPDHDGEWTINYPLVRETNYEAAFEEYRAHLEEQIAAGKSDADLAKTKLNDALKRHTKTSVVWGKAAKAAKIPGEFLDRHRKPKYFQFKANTPKSK